MKKLLVNALLVTSISSTLLAGNYSNESEVLSSMGGVSTGTNSTNFSVVGETFVSMSGAKSGFLLKGESTYVTSSSGVAIDLDYTTNGYDQDTVTHTDIETSEVVSTNTEKWIAVVAQNVENLDTYQVEVSFDASRLALIATAEDNSFGGLHNLLKKNGGTTIGFQAVETGAGIINISNALVGTDEAIAPEGTGLIALLKFKALDADTNNTINLQNVHFVNSSGSNALITNHINATFNPETINQAPVVNAGVDQTIIEGESASLQCVANDVDGSVTSTEWLKDGVLVSSQDRYTTPSTLAVGSYVYSCKATDDDGATNSDALTLTVEAPNQAPVVNAGADQTIIEGESASLQCVANDVDGSVTSTEWLKDGVLV
ncbi:MAG: immunoglobulin domain-containing protein, partial [Campylobacterota bacterium]|nr:immunoglobulin domain-containing protein [Campylobacterota bacterium]